ncbi:MAG TPA: 50S ribosomal protein L11 methyltransferase [Patescibacteria group bacterium]|nr:50S ribosomal protein L11 methyltransferase [Patescibacteria group bacterium]
MSANERLDVMLELSQIQPGQKTIDLGSGDGRVVIAMAKLGAQAHGIEIDPGRVELARNNILKENLLDKAIITQGNFWNEDLGEFDIITLYGITGIMERLEKKLKIEMKPGSKVISNFFQFPNWYPAKNKSNIFVYSLSNNKD